MPLQRYSKTTKTQEFEKKLQNHVVKLFNLVYNIIFLFFPLKEKNLNFNVELIYGHERRRRITVLVVFAILTVGSNTKREKSTLQNEFTTSSMCI